MQIGEHDNCDCGYLWGNDDNKLWIEVEPGGSREYL